jgi:hypothetical protein
MGMAFSTHGGKKNASEGMPEGKTPLERYKRTWEDNIKIDLEEVGWYGLD